MFIYLQVLLTGKLKAEPPEDKYSILLPIILSLILDKAILFNKLYVHSNQALTGYA